jgi:ABC-type branched-subunit amino acid transport system substrate-binding protein
MIAARRLRNRSRGRLGSVGSLLAAGVLAAGCGTTVSPAGDHSQGSTTKEGLGPAAAPASVAAPEVPSVTSGPVAGSALSAGNAAVQLGPGELRAAGPANRAAEVRARPQAVRGSLRIAIPEIKNDGASAAAFGLDGVGGATDPAGDSKTQWRALLDHANKQGGMLGHTLVPVFYEYDSLNQDRATADQALCAALTEDDHVFAMVIPRNHTDTLNKCLAKAGVVILRQSVSLTDDAVTFDKYPLYATTGALNLTRLSTAYVDGGVRAGYFAKGVKIGLVAWDKSDYDRATASALKPALARHGLKLTAEAAVAPTYDTADAGAAARDAQAAVLRFSTLGVDHVLFLGIAGNPSLFFIEAAQNEGYYPQYLLSSADFPNLLLPNISAESAANVWGVGWNPYLDLLETNLPLNEAGQRCKKVLAAYGQPPKLDACDSVSVLVAGIAAGGAPVSGPSFMSGLQRLGAVRPAQAFALRYGPKRNDGVAEVRPFRYLTSCSCIRYSKAGFAI